MTHIVIKTLKASIPFKVHNVLMTLSRPLFPYPSRHQFPSKCRNPRLVSLREGVSIPLKASILFKAGKVSIRAFDDDLFLYPSRHQSPSKLAHPSSREGVGCFHTPQGINPLQSLLLLASPASPSRVVSIPLKASIPFKVLRCGRMRFLGRI